MKFGIYGIVRTAGKITGEKTAEVIIVAATDGQRN